MECLKQRRDIKKMLHSYIKCDRDKTSKTRALGCKANGGGRIKHLFLLYTFSGIRINSGFAFNVGITLHNSLRSPVSFLRSQTFNTMKILADIFIFTCKMSTKQDQ